MLYCAIFAVITNPHKIATIFFFFFSLLMWICHSKFILFHYWESWINNLFISIITNGNWNNENPHAVGYQCRCFPLFLICTIHTVCSIFVKAFNSNLYRTRLHILTMFASVACVFFMSSTSFMPCVFVDKWIWGRTKNELIG